MLWRKTLDPSDLRLVITMDPLTAKSITYKVRLKRSKAVRTMNSTLAITGTVPRPVSLQIRPLAPKCRASMHTWSKINKTVKIEIGLQLTMSLNLDLISKILIFQSIIWVLKEVRVLAVYKTSRIMICSSHRREAAVSKC